MPKNSAHINEILIKNGCSGNLDEIEILNDENVNSYDIKNCTFIGRNRISALVSLRNATVENSTVDENVTIHDSIVTNSFIGEGTTIINYSVLRDTVITPTTIPQSGETYVSVICNSQLSGDVVLGGCDFNKTKSRGNSVFAFAHIGDGEFKKSLIIGNPPTAKSKKTLVEIGHFGYFGELLVMGFRVADSGGRSFDLDSKEYFESSKFALQNIFFGIPISNGILVEKGRTNIGAGTVISNYDPIRGTKAGAIILLSSIGANVSLSPYLTVLPNSLISSGSVDITREKNVILENSIAIGARSQSVILENYYDDKKRQIMNERSVEEVAYLQRYLSFLVMLSEVCLTARDKNEEAEIYGWVCSVKIIEKIALEIANKSIPKYLDLLEKSLDCINKILSENPSKSEDFEQRLYAHKSVLGNAKDIKLLADSKLNKIQTVMTEFNNSGSFRTPGSIEKKKHSSKNIVFTDKQKIYQ